MKKLFVLVVVLLMSALQIVVAQESVEKKSDSTSTIPSREKSEERIEIFRDRLMVDVFHTFWMGMPSQVNHQKFHPGFNVSVMWDFRVSPNSPISFGLGLGTSYYTQFSNAMLQYDSKSDVMRYSLLPVSVADTCLNRMTYINCHIPLEFRYRHSNGFKFSLGVRLGLVAEVSHRYKGPNLSGSGADQNFKSFEVFNKQKYNVDFFMRCGWKFVSVYYSYQVNKLFESGKGPQINPMSLGISFSIF